MGRTAVCCTCVHRTPSRVRERERGRCRSVGRPAAAGKEEEGGKFRKLSIPAVVVPSFLPLPRSVRSSKSTPFLPISPTPPPPPSPHFPSSSHTRSQCCMWKAFVSACSSLPSLPHSLTPLLPLLLHLPPPHLLSAVPAADAPSSSAWGVCIGV